MSPLRLLPTLLAALLCLGAARAGWAEGDAEPVLRPNWRDDYRRPAAAPYPDDNPFSPKKAALGATLFFDPVLSGSRTMACVTCHQPSMAWSDGLPRSIGDRRRAMDLRSPTLLNNAWVPRLGWDGKFATLESVAFRAITGPVNMDLATQEALDRLSASPAYVRRFEAAFGSGPITQDRVEQALATYERGLVSGPAPFDRWVDGDEGAVSVAAKRGFALFEGKAACSGCHSGWAFTDHSFHDIGSAEGKDLGRGGMFPTSVSLRYAFKVPTLRDVARRGPYMHDGSITTLEKVIDLYDRGGVARPSRSRKIKPLGLAPDEKLDLIRFLETLSEDPKEVVPPLNPH